MTFLYDTIERYFGALTIKNEQIPASITDNLNPKFEIRPYQKEAFQRYFLFYNEVFKGKPNKPYHILYNMATGSGKTFIMAGLILYLYERGYRNFLFFVHSNNIIEKTKDNFLNSSANKYLFNQKIVVNGQEVYIKETDNFESSDNSNINIKFTTIHQLHLDLKETKENSLTFECFKNKKTVLIADEAHHLSSGTKSGKSSDSWESTVLKILNQSSDNILLEFTATLDYGSIEILDKYMDKVIYKYNLSEFRQDKYSKEINLIRSMFDETERILQALVLNMYRQSIAIDRHINLKPVILFKAKRTIEESKQNKTNFHALIENLNTRQINNIKELSTVKIVQKAFAYFDQKGESLENLVSRIQFAFKEENCISANNDKEAELNQIRLNTLEDENNPIRAVFAVQKLNEGWDVLNLYDIVRLYDTRDGKGGKPGKTTIAEAQLIGRGARYCPFKLDDSQDKFKRKYDSDPENDLKILEELYYHTKEDSRYISEIKRALIETGIYDDDLIIKELKLKESFKKTSFYEHGYVYYNKKIPKDYSNIMSFADLGVTKKNYPHTLSSGKGENIAFFESEEIREMKQEGTPKDIKLSEIPEHIVRYALTRNPFFYFSHLQKIFPNVLSTSNFIRNKNHLGGLEITFKGSKRRLENISHKDYFLATQGLLTAIETEIKANLTIYQGSSYIGRRIHEVFINKSIRVNENSERANGQKDFLSDKDWYAYNANYGTSEEKEFVKMFARRFESINQKFENIYLIRNERVVKIHDKKGRAFEPDFILFCKQKNQDPLTFQVFIEPKGSHLIENDRWKEDFLKKIRDEEKTFDINTDKYIITGTPFYNNEIENMFKKTLELVLER